MAKFEEIKRAEKMLRLYCEENKECYGCCLYTPDGRCRVGCPPIWDEPLETRKGSVKRESASEKSTSAESRRRILNDAIQAVCSDRCQMYGEPEDNFGVIAELWNAYLNGALPEGGCTLDLGAWSVADMMILFKLGRAATALEEHRDTYVDIAGYAACAGGMIKAEGGGGNAEGGGNETIWLDMCRDPEYPCQSCKGVRYPRRCADKACVKWRRWAMLEWVRMQYRAGILGKAEFEKKVERINAEANGED